MRFDDLRQIKKLCFRLLFVLSIQNLHVFNYFERIQSLIFQAIKEINIFSIFSYSSTSQICMQNYTKICDIAKLLFLNHEEIVLLRCYLIKLYLADILVCKRKYLLVWRLFRISVILFIRKTNESNDLSKESVLFSIVPLLMDLVSTLWNIITPI